MLCHRSNRSARVRARNLFFGGPWLDSAVYAGGASIGNVDSSTSEHEPNGDWEGWHSYGGGGTALTTDSWRIRSVYPLQMAASWRASEWAPWRSRRARMLRRRRTLSVYATNAPEGSMFVASSSTADWARARASATVRLQDGAGVATRCEECASGICVRAGIIGMEERKIRQGARPLFRVGGGIT